MMPHAVKYDYVLPKRRVWERDYCHRAYGYGDRTYHTRFRYEILQHDDCIEILRAAFNWEMGKYEAQDSFVFWGEDAWRETKRKFRGYHDQFPDRDVYRKYESEAI